MSIAKLINARSSLLVTLVITMLPTFATAQPEDGERPPGPPPEAIEACIDLAEQDTCSFEGRRDDVIEGTCTVVPDDEILACKPEGDQPRPPRH